MKTKILSVLALATLMLASCSDNNETEIDDKGVPVQFTTNVGTLSDAQDDGPATRVVGDQWEENDAVGIFMTYDGNTNIVMNGANKKYVFVPGSNNQLVYAPGHSLFFQQSGAYTEFYAYHPYNASLTDNWKYNVDVSDQTSQSALDIMWGKTRGNKHVPNLSIGLTRKMSKIIVKLKPGTGMSQEDLVDMRVDIEQLITKAVFDISTGKMEVPNILWNNINTRVKTGGVEYEAITLPMAGKQLVFVVRKDAARFTKIFTSATLEAGKVYTYNITLHATIVEATMTIGDWIPGGNTNIDI